jgi:hypothetical protein
LPVIVTPVANINAALVENVLDVTQGSRKDDGQVKGLK